MLVRWVKRGIWGVMLVALVLVPTRFAHGPARVEANVVGPGLPAAVPFAGVSPVGLAGVGLALGGLALVALLRRR